MIDFVIDYMETAGVVFASRNELASVTEGVKLYLLENGIPEKDNRDYFKTYINRSLARIEHHEMKTFFIAYPVISRVNQICIEFRANNTLSEARKAELLKDMSELYSLGFGYKYIPAAEVHEILGRLA